MKIVLLYNLKWEQEMRNLACGDLICTEDDERLRLRKLVTSRKVHVFPSIYSEGVVKEGAGLLELVVILGSGCVEIC